jgi:hypothetical protein
MTRPFSPSKLLSNRACRVLAATTLLACAAPSASAALAAYYTLDDLGLGIQNQGTDGSTSDLSAPSATATPTVVTGGIRGDALSFDGNDLLSSLTPGNAGDDLLAYPFTMSVWTRGVLTATRYALFAVSNNVSGGIYYNTGVQGVSGRAEPELVRRNQTFTELDATGADASGTGWLNVVSVFGTEGAQIYVNGKLLNSVVGGQTFNASVNSISVGGFLRNNSTTTPTDPFRGQADDVGLFDTGLIDADAALIDGLGLTGGIGLDQLDEAQALNAMVTGSMGTIGGAQWRKATGLSGTTGDFGGSVSGGNAFIVTDAAGNGIQMVPEPGSAALLLLGLGALSGLRRRI